MKLIFNSITKMKARYFIIAGPQAAGKTTFIRYLNEKYKNNRISFLQEAREIVNNKYKLKGAISMTTLDEIEAIELDTRRMYEIREELKNDSNRIYIDECNIFTLAHTSTHGISIDEYFKEYCFLLEKLNPFIVFFDVPPEVSWRRREEVYRKRVKDLQSKEQGKILREYKKYIEKVHPELIKLYQKINFPKIHINTNSLQKSLTNVIKNFMIFLNY